MRRIQDIADLAGKKVLLRVDYNVPMKDGKVMDTERIVASLETIHYLVRQGAIVVICSHLGRPTTEHDPDLSLAPVAEELEKLNKQIVHFVKDCVGSDRDNAVAAANSGEIILLENLRFHKEEEACDSLFAQRLARGCDYYVNDAFSASHRAHASIVGVTEYLPAYAGFLLERELVNLSKLLVDPKRPFVFISGGAKVSDKVKVLENLVEKVDMMLIGGGMANTFLCSQRHEVGCSLYEEDFVKTAQSKGVRILLPQDVVVTKAIVENSRGRVVPVTDVEDMDIIADIGPETIATFEREIKKAGTIFWNGPVGVAEFPAFAKGTLAIGKAVAEAEAFSVIGGGDTIAALPTSLKDKYSFVSMAGGASMEFLEGKELPGIKVLG
jgi:phosphoglycerate kinase